jgi:hypothetical protein
VAEETSVIPFPGKEALQWLKKRQLCSFQEQKRYNGWRNVGYAVFRYRSVTMAEETSVMLFLGTEALQWLKKCQLYRFQEKKRYSGWRNVSYAVLGYRSATVADETSFRRYRKKR